MRTWRLSSSQFGDALRGHDQASFEDNLDVVKLEVVVREEGETGAEIQLFG